MTATPLIVTLDDVQQSDPVLIAYSVKRKRKGGAAWTRIGAAYPHDIGAGLTLILDALPTDGRIFLFERDNADDRRLIQEVGEKVSRRPRK